MRHVESNTQIACVRWFRYQYPRIGHLLVSIPNGGARNAVTGAILKAEGVVAGAPDLVLFVGSGHYHTLMVEMKTRTGRQSQSQKDFQALAESQDNKYVVCRSLDDFRNAVKVYFQNEG